VQPDVVFSQHFAENFHAFVDEEASMFTWKPSAASNFLCSLISHRAQFMAASEP
jgi:hypothetical protein